MEDLKLDLNYSQVKEIVDKNEDMILEYTKECIKECITDKRRAWGMKIYINYDKEIKNVSCPNEEWDTAYIKHLLFYIDTKKWKQRFNIDERLGSIKDRVSEDDFNYFVKEYAEEYEMDYDDALKDCIKDNNWREYWYVGPYGHYDKLVEEEVNKFLDTLNFSINEDLKVEVF